MKMSKLSTFALSILLIAFPHSISGQLELSGPLFPTSVIVEVRTSTITSTKGTPCFTTIAAVTECRRKRGIEEKALILGYNEEWQMDINPSQVLTVETTRAPRAIRKRFDSETILSSMDEVFYDSYKFFRQLSSFAGRQPGGKSANMITIASDCSGPIDFSRFLSCIGLQVQNTDTETSWFTTFTTITSGYSTVTLAGCTPPFFPYPLCSAGQILPK